VEIRVCVPHPRQWKCECTLPAFDRLLISQRHSDYSGFPLLKAITSASGDETHQFTHFWIHGTPSPTDGKPLPFLFVNGGAATLSGSVAGAAVVRDSVIQREIQLLKHTDNGRNISAMVRLSSAWG